MKKLLAIMIAVLTLFTLVSCDEDLSDLVDGDSIKDLLDGEGNGDVDPSDIDFDSILSGNGSTDTVWGKQDEATKQEIIAAGKAAGVEVTFSADGSMSVYDPATGSTIVQKPDGTWVIRDAEGNESQLGGSWPDNAFTRLIPKPPFDMVGVAITGNEFGATFQGSSMDEVKAYAASVKAAGFDQEVSEEDFSGQGYNLYTFEGYNADGHLFTVGYSEGVIILTVVIAEN